MGASKIITKEARKYVIEQIQENGQMSKSEIADLIRPHCTFDPLRLQDQAVNRLIGSICRSIRDESGVRSVFIAKGMDAVVNVETSTSLPLVTCVDEQLAVNLKGTLASKQKTYLKRQELSGQMSVFDERQVQY